MRNETCIIIPTYNQEEHTVKCFESIGKNTSNYTIIWVDNGSSEESRNKVLESLAKHKINYEKIFLPENLGFVKATNVGLEQALTRKPQYIVLQNNDTVVYGDWLNRMKRAMSREKAGLVGPITSPCKSWQSISHIQGNMLGFESLPSYNKNPETYSKVIAEEYDGQSIGTEIVLAFFCVLIKVEAARDIGLLSEDFGLGFGDDDDYSTRAMRKGWKLAIAKDVFVFHNHRSTFKSLFTDEKIDKMLKENNNIFKKKHSQAHGK